MRIRREILILVGILSVGALLRALYLAELVHYPDFAAPGVDAGYHDYWARAIITGEWTPPVPYRDPLIRTTPYFRPPGYTYFLALVYLLTGSSYLGGRIAQMALGLLSALPAFLFGRRWFGSRMGLIFAGLMAVYWGFIYFEGELLEPVLVTMLALLLIWDVSLWTERVTFARAMLTGFILGVSALVRPNILLFGPAILFWAWWILKDRRRFLTSALGLILATGLTISPATIRNYVVAHDFVPISSNSGINLLLGNNQESDGTISTVIRGLGEFNNCFDYPTLVEAVEKKVGRPLKHSEVSAYLGAQAKEYIKSRPGDALRLVRQKALMFWGPLEVGNNKEDEIVRAHSPVLRRIPGNFAIAAALCVVGLLAMLSDRRSKKEASRQFQVSLLALLFVAVYFISYLPYFAAGRFRMPMVPFLLFFGALGLDRIIRLAAERNVKAVGVWLLVLIAAYGLASRNFSNYEPDLAKWHMDEAIVLGNTGNPDGAIREYRAVLAIRPDHTLALYNMGMQLTYKQRYDEAADAYKQALDINPEDHQAHYGLGLVYSLRGEMEKAMYEFLATIHINPDFPLAHQELGRVLLARGQVDKAFSEFTQAIRLKPDLGSSHASMALILHRKGEPDEAAEHYREAVKTEPTPMIYFRYAGLLVSQKKLEEAARAYQNAVRLDPHNALFRFDLAVALAMLNRQDEAARQYREATRLRPDYVKAHKNLAVLLFVKEDYAGAWSEVRLCRKYGGTPHPEFVKALSEKMPEP